MNLRKIKQMRAAPPREVGHSGALKSTVVLHGWYYPEGSNTVDHSYFIIGPINAEASESIRVYDYEELGRLLAAYLGDDAAAGPVSELPINAHMTP